VNADHAALAIVIASAVALLWTQKLRTDLVALLVTLSLILPWPHPDGRWRSILTYQEGFSGFGSPAVVMVGSMFVFGAAMVRTGAATMLGSRLFEACAGSELGLQCAVLGVTTLVSMFVNDTTVVLVFMPLVVGLCKKRSLSPSRYLMLVAIGSLLGGQWTLVGTRSNIILSDALRERTGEPLGFFDFTPIAAAVFAACALYFVAWGRRLLPRAADSLSSEDSLAKEYLTEVLVTPESRTAGQFLDELPWASRRDLTIVEVIRRGRRMPPHHSLRLEPGDVLVMQGPVPTIAELLKSPDFRLLEELKIDAKTLKSVDLVAVEALLPPRSEYAGRTLEEVDFSRSHGFTVMGIARHGHTIRERPSESTLRFGDSLLLLGHVSAVPRLQRNANLVVLGQEAIPPVTRTKAVLVLALLGIIIATAVLGVLSPAISIPLVAMLVILTGCIKVDQAYDAVDWRALITVAGMIPFGLALEKTGAAERVAHGIVSSFEGVGPVAVLGALLAIAVALTQLIENAAVAIILAPLALRLAAETGSSPKPFMVALAICVSAAFCTPIAHESTILVMGPGRYQFRHYLLIGSVMAFLTWLIATFVTPLVWPLAG
jgi:di/tricarboxylate transporter